LENNQKARKKVPIVMKVKEKQADAMSESKEEGKTQGTMRGRPLKLTIWEKKKASIGKRRSGTISSITT